MVLSRVWLPAGKHAGDAVFALGGGAARSLPQLPPTSSTPHENPIDPTRQKIRDLATRNAIDAVIRGGVRRALRTEHRGGLLALRHLLGREPTESESDLYDRVYAREARDLVEAREGVAVENPQGQNLLFMHYVTAAGERVDLKAKSLKALHEQLRDRGDTVGWLRVVDDRGVLKGWVSETSYHP